MARAVLDEFDQVFAFAEEVEDLAGKDDIAPFVSAGDVVDLAGLPFPERQVDAAAVVLDVEPVADVVFAAAVEREGLVVDGVGDEEGKDLLRVLIGSVGVGAAGDGDGGAEGVEMGQGDEFAAGLACRLGIARAGGIVLGE